MLSCMLTNCYHSVEPDRKLEHALGHSHFCYLRKHWFCSFEVDACYSTPVPEINQIGESLYPKLEKYFQDSWESNVCYRSHCNGTTQKALSC
jgi:hypothetical protein